MDMAVKNKTAQAFRFLVRIVLSGRVWVWVWVWVWVCICGMWAGHLVLPLSPPVRTFARARTRIAGRRQDSGDA